MTPTPGGGVDQVEFVVVPPDRSEPESGCVGEMAERGARGECRGGASPEDHGAEGQVDGVDEPGPDECAIESGTAFGDGGGDAPFTSKPGTGVGEIDPCFGIDPDGVREPAEAVEPGGAGGLRGQRDDGGEPGGPDGCLGGEGGAAGDDDAEGGGSEAVFEAELPEAGGTVAEACAGEFEGACAAEDGVGPCAPFVEVFEVPGGTKAGY